MGGDESTEGSEIMQKMETIVIESPIISVDCGNCQHHYEYKMTIDPTILECPKCRNVSLQQVSYP